MSDCLHEWIPPDDCPICMRAEVERLRAILAAVRICFKNRDQSEWEAKLYAEICRTLEARKK